MDIQLNGRMRFIVSAFSLAIITVTACDTGPVEPVGRRPIGLVTGGGSEYFDRRHVATHIGLL